VSGRVTFRQECGRIRSLITKAGKEHLRPPAHARNLNYVPPRPTDLQIRDSNALFHLEQAVRHIQQAEKSWDQGGSDDEA
jgi:hypothetical protein